MHLLTVLTTLFTLAYAVTRVTPPEGAIVVSKKSCHGQFTTIQAAVGSLSTTSKSEQPIFIDRGVYEEQVLIPQRSAKLTVYGYTTDTTNYEANEVSITFNISSPEAGGNDQSGTVRVLSADTHLCNLNIANTFGKGAQAVALSAQNDKQGYYGVKLTGYQDTLLSNTGDQFYSRSLITGRTDFIFGARARS
jgi:pectinesterase